VGPELSFLKDTGRATYLSTTDDEALEAFQLCSRLEGILPALEPSHALARIGEIAREIGKGGLVVLNLSGRGDKDIFTIAEALGNKI
ncbi:MAG: tryptophan synthase subunit beta, partial [Pseudomonadota bacterium]